MLCGALFLDALDVSMVVVALPAIRAGAAVALTGLHRRVPPGGGESVPVVAGRTPGCGSPGAVAAHRRD